jgi:hypothetical protein
MRRSFRTQVSFSGRIPRVCTLGWYAMPHQGMRSKTGSTLRQNAFEPHSKDVRRNIRCAARRHCSRVRWPRFPHLAIRPHRSNTVSETVIVQHTLKCRIPAQGNALGTVIYPEGVSHTSPGHRPGNRIPENKCVLKEHRIGSTVVDVRDTETMRRSFRTQVYFAGRIPRVCTLGWYAMPLQGMGSEMWWPGPLSEPR